MEGKREEKDDFLSSQPAIDLVRPDTRGKGVPGVAALPDAVGKVEVGDLVGLEDELGKEARAGVPGDVAVEGPGARVARLDLQHNVAERAHVLHVAAHRIVRPHKGLVGVVTSAVRQDVHVQAVGVDWMRAKGLC